MDTLLNATDRITRYMAWVGGSVLLLTCFMIATEVVLRKGFSISLGGADEISNYALAMSTSWAFAFALFRKAHIRIDVLYTRLGRGARFALDILSLGLFAVFMTLVTYHAGMVVFTSIIRRSVANTPLGTPLWIPQSVWLIGLVSFCMAIYLILAGVIYHLLQGRARSAAQLASASSLDEEIAEEESTALANMSPEGGVQ